MLGGKRPQMAAMPKVKDVLVGNSEVMPCPTQQGEKVLTGVKAALGWHRSRFRFVAGLTQVPKEEF